MSGNHRSGHPACLEVIVAVPRSSLIFQGQPLRLVFVLVEFKFCYEPLAPSTLRQACILAT